jgi:agmatinase
MQLKPTLQPFLDKGTDPENADIVLFAAPLDKTTSHRSGTRFGPHAVRMESTYLDTYSARTGLDWDELSLSDIGDVDCPDVETALKGVQETVLKINGLPVMLGGEHTITLGALRALKPDLVIVFDAHLDLRDELFGERICHATYLRRGLEELGCRALIVGARALSGEEVDYAASNKDVAYITPHQIRRGRVNPCEETGRLVAEADRVYVSLDMDALDPCYAPAVGNPHPEGLSPTQVLDIMEVAVNGKLVGLDVNEVYPHYDTGQTANAAAYLLLEALYIYIKASRAS